MLNTVDKSKPTDMGSKVLPYFILTAEKVTDLKEVGDFEQEQLFKSYRRTPKSPPITPSPSGVSYPSDEPVHSVKKTKKRRELLKYKIPVRSLRKRSSMNTRMELIKEKLERSRERYKQKTGVLNGLDENCVPTVIGLNNEVEPPLTLDRSVSDLTGQKTKKNSEGTFPYVYFVVSENTPEHDETENEENTKVKSADKKKRVKIMEQNKHKKDKKDQMAKMQGLARELGLKTSVVEPKASDSKSTPQASVNQIVFPDTIPEHPKSKHTNELPVSKATIHGVVHHSPTRVPPGTPATFLSDNKIGNSFISDVDEQVPRKPFLSGPLYAGKVRGLHSCSLQNVELPTISPEQKRRALGLGSSTRFDEYAYPKPRSEQRDRKVCFADQLPVIRGSGFVLSGNENRNSYADMLPSLGPRAATVGSITLPSEKVDKQSLCQRFLLGENVSSARTMRRNGVPMPLPKIDIVSNVYDEMIVKMIQEYLQVSNTPTRQSQLAKDLLVHLQKHNDTMKEINVPMVKVKRESALRAEQESVINLHKKARHAIFKEMDLYPPPNTAEIVSTAHGNEFNFQNIDNNDLKEEENEEEKENVPHVEITYKNKPEDENVENKLNEEGERELPKSAKSGRSSKSRERPVMNTLTPVSFQMAPPGLSKEDTSLSLCSNN